MDCLPSDIKNIIIDYKEQLEVSDKKKRVLKQLTNKFLRLHTFHYIDGVSDVDRYYNQIAYRIHERY